jgi:hypothetical protein
MAHKKYTDMETIYTAYTKLLDCKTHYFVKKFISFPELKNVSPILESYGMHINFDKACSIAGITNTTTKEQLLHQIEETPRAKVVELGSASFSNKSVAG